MNFYSPTKQILFGDFNGDGKVDVLLPEKDNDGCEDVGCNGWRIYYSNPYPVVAAPYTGFFNSEFHTISNYMPVKNYNYSQYRNTYYALDINKDGKSDLVWYELEWKNTSSFGWREHWRLHTYINNIGNPNNPSSFINDYNSDFINNSVIPGSTFPFFGNSKYGNKNTDFTVICNKDTSFACSQPCYYKFWNFYSFNKNYTRDNSLSRVIESGGAIINSIEYQPMIVSGLNYGHGLTTDFYSTNNSFIYPYITIRNMPSNRLVSKIINSSIGINRYQDFKYQGLVAQIDGMGFLGFIKTARSNWYTTSSLKKIWSVNENDPLKRGANILSYNRILDSSQAFDFATPLSTGLTSRIDYTYYPVVLNTSKKYTLLLESQITSDYLTNVITKKYLTYSSDDYNLPKVVISRNFLGETLQGATTTSTNYTNQVALGATGANYYIGRPTDVTTTVEAYGDVKSTYEKYMYTNGNMTTKEKRAGTTAASAIASTEKIVETMAYATNGNLMSKTITAVGFPVALPLKPALEARTTSYTYDTTNRFIKTTTDVDGVVTTNDTYHPLYGVVLQQTNTTLGQTSTNIYDNWGKRTKITDFLGKSINYAYTKVNNIYTTTQTGSDDSSSSVDSDALARVIRKGSKNINNLWSYTSIEYDALSRKIKESLPYFDNETLQWSKIEYDDYSRPVKKLEFQDTKITTLSYSGLTTTVNDGRLTTTSITNANGHTVSTTETATNGSVTGGTITNTYNALGNLLTSSYDSVVTTMVYDLWGRKTQLTDPSAGIFKYDYNAFG